MSCITPVILLDRACNGSGLSHWPPTEKDCVPSKPVHVGMWCTKWHCNRCSSENFAFPLSASFQ